MNGWGTLTRDAAQTEPALGFLRLAARLLLEYDVRTELLERSLGRAAKSLGADLVVVVGYREVTLSAAGGRSFHVQVRELRINAAISVEVLRVVDGLAAGLLPLDAALARLETVERTAPGYGRWLPVVMFGAAAAALAWLLGADAGAIVVAGVASALGLLARRELGRRHVALVAQPFTAGLIGAAIGGLAIRFGWTATPASCVIVPALMLVPGPHLINSLDDMLGNHMQTGLCRLALALNLLMGASLGVVLGVWLTLGSVAGAQPASSGAAIPLLVDVALAALAACGFGVFYNAPWRALWVSMACGVAGHGVRYLCLDGGLSLEISTLLGCVPVGVIGSIAADRLRLPFSAVAFAGAVPMMPGVAIYQSIAGAMRLSLAGPDADAALAAATLALSFRAAFVVGALSLGLMIGAAAARAGARMLTTK